MLTQNNTTFRYSEVNDIPELLKVIDNVEVEEKEKSEKMLLERTKQKQILCIALDN